MAKATAVAVAVADTEIVVKLLYGMVWNGISLGCHCDC